jgi:hypothetical protein
MTTGRGEGATSGAMVIASAEWSGQQVSVDCRWGHKARAKHN